MASPDTPAPGSHEPDARPVVEFDYSTPEAQALLSHFSEMAMTIRSEYYDAAIERRMRLYERTLGLAVLPVLIRRGLIVLFRRFGRSTR